MKNLFYNSIILPCVVLAGYSAKRGFVADGCSGSSCTDVKLLNPGWYYDYNPQDKFADSTNPDGYTLLFSPMHWCEPLNASIPSTVNTTFVLGPNEPNNLHNCNKSPSDIARAWAGVLTAYQNSILVSPATAGNGIPWLDAFFGNCTEMYGSKGCRISHVAVHDYTCDPNTLLSYLQQVHDRYKMPVWLTEFSCGDGADNKPQKDHLAYMQKVVPMLDKADFVYRYAWMSAKSPNRGLFTNPGSGQTLSEVGKLYASL